jgi:hypothetical protein
MQQDSSVADPKHFVTTSGHRHAGLTQGVVESWNSIPPSLKQAETVRAFKNGGRHRYMKGAGPDSCAVLTATTSGHPLSGATCAMED